MKDILVPISPGELLDKITILRIKQDKIRGQAAQQNIRHELDELEQVRKRTELNSTQLAILEEQLFATNLELWKILDDQQEAERAGDFGPRFVEMARLVYKLNDRRATLKKEINQITRSVIVEEKLYAG